MQTIIKALSSRTVWMVIAMFIIGGFQNVQNLMPAGDIVYVQGLIGLLATYFKLNPSKSY